MSMTTPPPGSASLLPETLTDAHHDALKRSWDLPAYEKTAPPGPAPSRRLLVVGLLSGALGLAIGAGVGYWAASERIAGLEAAPPIAVPATVPEYSVSHDSRIIEAPQTIEFGRWTRPATVQVVNPQ
ncbi:MAG: hypothetical protein WCF36_14925 [Candidatus Nanopelagicales bacterium]